MELTDLLLGTIRRRQQRLLSELGVSGKPGKELVGPESKPFSVAEVDNGQFLEILKKEKPARILSRLPNFSETFGYHEFYVDVGEDVQLKTRVSGTASANQRTFFSNLREIAFKYNPAESRPGWGVYSAEGK